MPAGYSNLQLYGRQFAHWMYAAAGTYTWIHPYGDGTPILLYFLLVAGGQSGASMTWNNSVGTWSAGNGGACGNMCAGTMLTFGNVTVLVGAGGPAPISTTAGVFPNDTGTAVQNGGNLSSLTSALGTITTNTGLADTTDIPFSPFAGSTSVKALSTISGGTGSTSAANGTQGGIITKYSGNGFTTSRIRAVGGSNVAPFIVGGQGAPTFIADGGVGGMERVTPSVGTAGSPGSQGSGGGGAGFTASVGGLVLSNLAGGAGGDGFIELWATI